ncbi:hypothetical protein K435DRAFT_861310 [Dendrothele bispora CBS 962.96]|uniref:Uncharacterized protein n=1 Tax=Dendrothele bispora (strain CBS 962.96) TaxID=1314807 RepID=A0A4S8LVT3_DENBC|nr:hypothetical protein K435DRAFT_861310 [Dendrothele bispora CBS 962.96]
MAGGGGGGYAPSITGMSDVMSFGNRSMSTVMANPVLLAGALQAEVKAGRNLEIFDSFKPFYCPSSPSLCYGYSLQATFRRPLQKMDATDQSSKNMPILTDLTMCYVLE